MTIKLTYGKEVCESDLIAALTLSRDYIYCRLEDHKKTDNQYTHSEIEYLRDTLNTLNAEICLLREELKRKEYDKTVNDMPTGYTVIQEEGDRILVGMSFSCQFKDCAETIVYRNRKYKYAELELGPILARWYDLEN